MAHGSITDEELAELIQRTEQATSAFMRGDMHRYLALMPHGPGFMLMNPFGGEPTRYDDRRDSLLKAADFFKAGDAKLDVVQTYASGDLVVLVMIERQHGEVGGLPDQEWPLRVTQIYRREGSEWQLMYRLRTRSSVASAWSRRRASPAADPPLILTQAYAQPPLRPESGGWASRPHRQHRGANNRQDWEKLAGAGEER